MTPHHQAAAVALLQKPCIRCHAVPASGSNEPSQLQDSTPTCLKDRILRPHNLSQSAGANTGAADRCHRPAESEARSPESPQVRGRQAEGAAAEAERAAAEAEGL